MVDQQPIVNLESDRLLYGPFAEDHVAYALKWANTWAVSKTRGMVLRPYSAETVMSWREHARTSSEHAQFVIYERASHRAIGETGFTQINWFHRSAEYGILIGETDCWGNGYGTEATRTMLAYGFAHLNLHTIWLRVSNTNPAGITAYTRAGFREAGRLREAQLIDGRRSDVIYMDCVATEFHAAS